MCVDDQPRSMLIFCNIRAGMVDKAGMSKLSHQQALDALHAVGAALLIVDDRGRVLYRNAEAHAVLAEGDGLADLLGCEGDLTASEILDELARLPAAPAAVSLAERSLSTGPAAGRKVRLRLRRLGEADGPALIELRDASAEASLRRRLAASERLASVGELAGKVAHEMNNPLDGILRYLRLAERAAGTGDGDKLNDYLDRARGGLDRLGGIIVQLLDYSRAAGGKVSGAPLRAIVAEGVDAMSPILHSRGVRVDVDLADGDRLAPSNLLQVVCNLVKNAADAMDAGGALTITGRVMDDRAVVTFQDTGPGVAPDVAADIFEPFYSTKSAGQGAGLGLSICRDLLARHGGSIRLAESDGPGARFVVECPCENAAEARA